MPATTQDEVWRSIVEILGEIREQDGVDAAGLSESTTLDELGVSSVDAIHLLISLEDRFRQKLSLQELVMVDGQYVNDLSLGQLKAFLCRKLNLASAS